MHCRQTVPYIFAYCSHGGRWIQAVLFLNHPVLPSHGLILSVRVVLSCILCAGLVSWFMLAITETHYDLSVGTMDPKAPGKLITEGFLT